MPYTLGTQHALAGSDSAAIAAPIGLKLATSGSNPSSRNQVGSPTRWWGMGHVSIGNSDGWLLHVPIRTLAQLVYPLPDGLTQLGWTLPAGVSVLATELVGTAYTQMRPNPWDRSPVTVSWRNAPAVIGPTSDTILWTYTVPAGRRLWVSKLSCYVLRNTVASSIVYAVCYVTINGAQCISAPLASNTLGQQIRDEAGNGNLILNPGDLVVARYQNLDTGGYVWCEAGLVGTLFDA